METNHRVHRVTREELETRLESFQKDLQSKVADKSERIKAVVVGSLFVALLIAFWLGRRSGKRRAGIIEIFTGKK